jgi:hypothetical protein
MTGFGSSVGIEFTSGVSAICRANAQHLMLPKHSEIRHGFTNIGHARTHGNQPPCRCEKASGAQIGREQRSPSERRL